MIEDVINIKNIIKLILVLLTIFIICNIIKRVSINTFQIGAIDNWTPADACEYFVSELKKSKDNIDITVYENSHHGFDTEEDIIFIEHAYSFTDCMFDISDDGAILMNYLNFSLNSV